jgi:hypothetical protein
MILAAMAVILLVASNFLFASIPARWKGEPFGM